MDVRVVALSSLGGAERAAVLALLAERARLTGHWPLPEPQRLAVEGGVAGAAGADAASVTSVLAEGGGALVGCAFVSSATDGSVALHVVVGGGGDGGDGGGAVADALIDAALAEVAAGTTVSLWAMQATAQDDELARRHGFVAGRDLLQMRVPLPLPDTVLAGVTPLATRPFDPARDEEVWLDVNNRAFAGHPEQGHWTLAQLRQRLAAGWVDLDGFLVADAPDGDSIIGSCWTKVHAKSDPVLGEIYIISVDPARHGKGWGKSLTVAGLQWLAAQGIAVWMLYTDADNEAAVALYRGLGFTVDHIDRAYLRVAASG